MYYSEENSRAAWDARIHNLADKANALASANSYSRQRTTGRVFEENDNTYGYDSELWRQLGNVICDFAQQSQNCPTTIEGWKKFINRLIEQLSQSQSRQQQSVPRQTRPQKKTKPLPSDFFSSQDYDMENDTPQATPQPQPVVVRQPLTVSSNSTLNTMRPVAEHTNQSGSQNYYQSRNGQRSTPRPQRSQNYDETAYQTHTQATGHQPGNYYEGVHHTGSGVVFQGSADPRDSRSHYFGSSIVSGSGLLFQGTLPPDLAVQAAQTQQRRQNQLPPQAYAQTQAPRLGQRLGEGSGDQAVVQSRAVASNVRTMTPAEATRLRWQSR